MGSDCYRSLLGGQFLGNFMAYMPILLPREVFPKARAVLAARYETAWDQALVRHFTEFNAPACAGGVAAARDAGVACECPSEWNLIGNVAAIHFSDRVDAVPVVHATKLAGAAPAALQALWPAIHVPFNLPKCVECCLLPNYTDEATRVVKSGGMGGVCL